MHWQTGKHEDHGHKTCYIKWHNDLFFGLGKNDWKHAGLGRKEDWKTPTNKMKDKNKALIKGYQKTGRPPSAP